MSDGASELQKGRTYQRWARLRLPSQRGYPPVYHYRWFPILERHPDPTVDTLEGYVWIETPWKIQSMWAAHLEIADSPRL